jgi:hypothetical protein
MRPAVEASAIRRGSVTSRKHMSPTLTIENDLILACARTDPDVRRIQDLVEHGPDWQGILRKAERWGLAPLVYTNLRQAAQPGQVPRGTTERLRHLYHRDTAYGVARREVLRAILGRFLEASVSVIVLKGAALAALVYPSPTLRPMGDIDLLVHPRDRDRVDSSLAHLGPERCSRLHIQHHISGPGGPAARPAATLRIPIEDIWERARPARIESVATLVLSHEDLLLQLALDVATRLSEPDGFVGHVRTLCDIGETCRRYGSAIDWSRLVTRAAAYDVAKQLSYALRLARDLVGAGVPSDALTDLRAGFGQLPLEDRFITAVARHAILSDDLAAGPPSTFSELAAHLLATRRARDGVMAASRLMARSCRARVQRLVAGPGPWRVSPTGSGGSEPSLGPGPSEAPSSNPSPPDGSMIRLGAQRRPSTQTVAEVAVTYDQTTTDGVGAQLLRIYGLYALSRALHTKYVHTPIGHVGYQGFLPLLTGRTDPEFTARYNAFFSLPSDDFDLESCERVRIHILRRDTVERYRQHAAATGRPVLLQAIHHYGYTDQHPEAFEALCAVSPYRSHRPAGPIRVCIHLRRGDNSVPGRTDGQQRMLPNRYYLRLCGTVLDALRRQGAPFVVRLHSEVPPRRYTLYPDTPGLYFWLDQPATVDPSEYGLEDFGTLPNLEMVVNVEPREALDDFATADVLILSRSSLGYLGGLLNPHGVVVYAPWWHPPLPHWLVADEHGNLDPAQVATCIADHVRRRS